MVFDLSGIHRLVFRYCHCDRRTAKHIQLLRARWFPATIERPSTAFAFDFLDFFHKLQDQSKCNPYDFYNAVLQRTNAAGLNPEIVCSFFSASVFLDLITDLPSIATTSLPSFTVSGCTSTSSNEAVPCTRLLRLRACLVEVWQLHVLRAPNRGGIHSPFQQLNCMNSSLYLFSLVLTHRCCKMEKQSDSRHRRVLQGETQGSWFSGP